MLLATRESYPGGKGGAGVYQRLISMMPPHKTYIEGFLGGGSVVLNKRPAEKTILIDLARAALALKDYSGHGFEVVHGDFLKLAYDFPLSHNTLVYLDPPYLLETRLSKRLIYAHEFETIAKHEQLLKLALTLPCMVMISGYRHELYTSMLHRWRLETFHTSDRGGNRREECVWLNFPVPARLHDYRYIGSDFTDRQRIKRKQVRWRKRLKEMPAQERYAMFSILEELV